MLAVTDFILSLFLCGLYRKPFFIFYFLTKNFKLCLKTTYASS